MYEDFIKYGSAEKYKENGKLRIEGKEHSKDGDVLPTILDHIFSCLNKQELLNK